MQIRICDSHKGMRSEKRDRLRDFFAEVKNISKEEAEKQVDFCDWYGKNFAVAWFEAIAYEGKTIVGYLRCLRNPSDVTEWYIGDVHVKEGYRERGIAGSLYIKTINELYSYERAERVISTVDKANVKSIGLHKKFGFIDTGLVETFDVFEIPETETKYLLELFSE